METLINPSNIMFIIGLLAVLFSVYHYFKNPQIDGDKRDALLEQRVQWQNEGNDRKFKEIQDSFQSLLLQSNNHIHTVDTKVDNLSRDVGGMGKEITRLATIIEERIPKK